MSTSSVFQVYPSIAVLSTSLVWWIACSACETFGSGCGQVVVEPQAGNVTQQHARAPGLRTCRLAQGLPFILEKGHCRLDPKPYVGASCCIMMYVYTRTGLHSTQVQVGTGPAVFATYPGCLQLEPQHVPGFCILCRKHKAAQQNRYCSKFVFERTATYLHAHIH
jgi:hypothetical protein